MAPPEHDKPVLWLFLADMMAGGISGAVSKTIAAPLERVKLLMQTQKLNPALLSNPYKGPMDSFKRIYHEEGLAAFWRGNMASIYRYFPNHALNFALKDQYKRWSVIPIELEEKVSPQKPTTIIWLTHRAQFHLQWKMINNILAGGIAGGLALFVCHPFDVARTK